MKMKIKLHSNIVSITIAIACTLCAGALMYMMYTHVSRYTSNRNLNRNRNRNINRVPMQVPLGAPVLLHSG